MDAQRTVTRLAFAADPPAFAGHFPGRPVVPAAALLAEVLAAAEARTGRDATGWRVAHAKFLAPVAPGRELELALAPEGAGGCGFEIRADGALVASGVLAAAPGR